MKGWDRDSAACSEAPMSSLPPATTGDGGTIVTAMPTLVTVGLSLLYPAEAPATLRDWKHSRQNTGRPWVGRKGTVVSRPHCEQTADVSTRPGGPPLSEGLLCRFVLHGLQRFGSFLNSFS